MSQTEATRQADWILPPCVNAAGSSNACAFPLATTPTIVDLNSIISPPDFHDGPSDVRDHGPLGHYTCFQAQGVDAFVIFGPSIASMTSGQVSGLFIQNINGQAGGSGYVTAPTVTISAGGGSGAAGSFVFTGGSNVIASVTVTAAGSGYSNAPLVTVSGGSLGTGATFVSSIFSSVGSFYVGTAGTGYGSAPTVTVTGGGGSGAAGTAVLSGTTVATITLTAAGSGYINAPTVSLSGGGGTGAAATAYIFSSVSGVTVTAGGSLYPAGATPSFAAGGGSGATATAVIDTNRAGGILKSITITAAGSGYTSVPTVTLGGGSNIGAQAAVLATLGTTPSATATNAVSASGSITMNPAVTLQIPAGFTASFKLPEAAPGPSVPWGINDNWRFFCFMSSSSSGTMRVWQSSD